MLASRFGLVYVPDHVNVAAELARVARPGARLGFTAWRPNPKLGELYRRFTDEPIEGLEAYEWGREDHVEDMLGEDFELDYADGTVQHPRRAPARSCGSSSRSRRPRGPCSAASTSERAEEFRQAFVELYEEHRTERRDRHPAPVPARARTAALTAALELHDPRGAFEALEAYLAAEGFWGARGRRRRPLPRLPAVGAAAPQRRCRRRPSRARCRRSPAGSAPARRTPQVTSRHLQGSGRGSGRGTTTATRPRSRRCARRSRAATSTR